jgi:hypothetical protein
MAQNVGTLISSAIRPNNSLDPIASAFASEIKGGLHTVQNITDRDSIIFERREWGMMCYVVLENKTYQLTHGYYNTDIMENLNWKEFSGSGGGSGGGEWIDSVISIENNEPLTPSDGDRYLIGNSPNGPNWSFLSSDLVVQWNSSLSQWVSTTPTDGMSVRVDNLENTIYKYEGVHPNGSWKTEKLNMVRYLSFNSSNGASYSTTSDPPFNGYTQDLVFLSKFMLTNTGATVSVNINSLGNVNIKKVSNTGLVDLNPGDIRTDIIYSLYYDGTYFQLTNPSNESLFNVKYYIEPDDYIVVPQYYQYWVYGDLLVAGNLVNYGHVIIANGSLNIIGSGSVTHQSGSQFVLVSLSTGMPTTYNDSDTIQFSYEDLISGPSVSAIVKDGSLTSSKLDTGLNGGPTAGYLLSVDDNGDFSWVQPSISNILSTTDDKNFIVNFNSIGDGYPTGLTISSNPLGHVGVYVNGVEIDLGYGSTVSNSCYFSDDGGTTAKDIENILAGDVLYWNSSMAGFNLGTEVPDRISLHYIV